MHIIFIKYYVWRDYNLWNLNVYWNGILMGCIHWIVNFYTSKLFIFAILLKNTPAAKRQAENPVTWFQFVCQNYN